MANEPGGGNTGPKPEDLRKQIEELNKKLREAGGYGINIAEAMRKAGDNTEELQKVLNQVNKSYQDLTDNADYIYTTFRDITAELKNQNVLLTTGRKSFKEFTSIAQDLNYYQKGSNDLTDKQFNQIKKSISLEKDELDFVVKRLEATKNQRAQEVANLEALLLQEGISKRQRDFAERRLKELNKENELLINGQEALKYGIPIIEKELTLTKQIADSRKTLGGLAKATGEVLSKYGGSLASFLNLSEASEAVEEFNKNLVKEALENEKVQEALLEIEKKKIELEKEGKLTDIERAKLDNQAYAIKQKAIADVTNSMSNKFKSLGTYVTQLGEGLKKMLLDPVAIITFIVGRALDFNKASVEIGKNFGYGAKQADAMAQSLANMANSSTNINVTFKNLIAAMNELNTATGGVAEYSKDTLETQIMLTKQFGLTGEEAAGIYKFSTLTGKSASQLNKEMVGAFASTRNAVKGSADLKATFAEVSKISGQLAANFKNNAVEMTKAVVQAQALGTTLEQTKNQSEKLLDFESSIESELKAELLTGQQMNLERARAYALQGNMVGVMQELANQGMTLEKFNNMNVLAQKAYAEALGLSADQLSDQLRKQKMAQEQGKSLAQITQEEALAAQKRQAVQDKFNAAIEKLQDFFGNLVAGPVGQLLEVITNVVGIIQDVLQPVLNVVFTPISWALKGLQAMVPVLKVIAGIYLAIKGYQLLSNAYKAISIGLIVKEAATEQGKLSLQNMQYLLGKQSMGVKVAAYALSLKDLVVDQIKIGINRASYAIKALQMGQEAFITREKGVQGIMEKQSLGSKIAYNLQLLAGLIREQGITGIKTYANTLDDKSIAKKIIMFGWDSAMFIKNSLMLGQKEAMNLLDDKSIVKRTIQGMLSLRESITQKAIAGFMFLKNTYETIALGLKRSALLLTIREAWKSIAGAAMSAFESAAKIPYIGWILGGIAAAGAIALGASLMSKGNDVISPGYGKRTLLAPEGAIALNDKDTVIAGTKLGNDVVSKDNKVTKLPEGTINPKGKKEESIAPQIDLTPMIAAINEVKAAVDRLYSKESTVKMDGKEVGSTLTQGTTKTA